MTKISKIFNLGHGFSQSNAVAVLSRYLRETHGATAVEYSLIVGGLSVAIIAVVFNLGEDIAELWDDFLIAFKELVIRYT